MNSVDEFGIDHLDTIAGWDSHVFLMHDYLSEGATHSYHFAPPPRPQHSVRNAL